MDKISSELAELMAAKFRELARVDPEDTGIYFAKNWVGVAAKIVEKLPKPVDPDVIEARKICKNSPAFWVTSPGAEDDPLCALGLVVAAIKRGRELAGGAA